MSRFCCDATVPRQNGAIAPYTNPLTSKTQFNGKLAVVLDASASTRGYGQREYCCISQSVALKLVLEKCCDRLEVYSAGGSGQIPIPEGNTDLATALLDAVESQPDLVAIVSDG